MIVKTAVNKYINASKEIFLQSGLDFVSVNKEENVERQFGYSVSHAKVKKQMRTNLQMQLQYTSKKGVFYL